MPLLSEFEAFSLTPVFISGDEKRYHCPFCEKRRGREDRDAKFYLNLTKGLGFCFKCEVKVIADRDHLSEPENLLRLLDIEEEKEEIPSIGNFRVGGWGVPLDESPEGERYLKARGLSVDSSRHFSLRFLSKPSPSVILPNGYDDGKTNYYQIRFLQKGKTPKYYSPKGVAKPLCYLSLVDTDRLIITEGMFSAIAAWEHQRSHKYRYSPVAALGLHLSPYQIWLLEDLSLQEIVIMLDGGCEDKAYKMSLSLSKSLTRCPPIRIASLPVGKDPNEVDKMTFSRSLTSATHSWAYQLNGGDNGYTR